MAVLHNHLRSRLPSPSRSRPRHARRLFRLEMTAPLALSLCLIAFPAKAQAQAPERHRAVVGVIGGASYARFAGDAHGTAGLPGTVIGLQVEVPASTLLALRGELLYHQRGSRHVYVGTAANPPGEPRLPLYQDAHWNYLELNLPVLLRPLGPRIHILAGPGVGLRLSHREEFVQDYQLEWRQQQYPNPEDPTGLYEFNGIFPGSSHAEGYVLAGIGGTIGLGRANVLIEARYQWGLQDLNPRQTVELYGRSLTLMTGLAF